MFLREPQLPKNNRKNNRTLSRALNTTVATVIAGQVKPMRTTVEQPLVIEAHGGTWFRTPCPNCRYQSWSISHQCLEVGEQLAEAGEQLLAELTAGETGRPRSQGQGWARPVSEPPVSPGGDGVVGHANFATDPFSGK